MCSTIFCCTTLILQELCLIKEEIQGCKILCVYLELFFQTLYNEVRDVCNLENAIGNLIVLTTKILESTLKEQPDINRLETFLVTIFLQETSIFVVNCRMSNSITLVVNRVGKEVAKVFSVHINEQVKVTFLSVEYRGNNAVE